MNSIAFLHATPELLRLLTEQLPPFGMLHHSVNFCGDGRVQIGLALKDGFVQCNLDEEDFTKSTEEIVIQLVSLVNG
jgi:hypothetical protein